MEQSLEAKVVCTLDVLTCAVGVRSLLTHEVGRI